MMPASIFALPLALGAAGAAAAVERRACEIQGLLTR